MQADEKPESQAAASKVCSQIPSKEKLGDEHFHFLPLPWAGGTAAEGACVPI